MAIDFAPCASANMPVSPSKLLNGSHPSIVSNEHFDEDGEIVFREACNLGCEGIVSKRLGSTYRCGRSLHWVHVKNPKAPAVKGEEEIGRGLEPS